MYLNQIIQLFFSIWWLLRLLLQRLQYIYIYIIMSYQSWYGFALWQPASVHVHGRKTLNPMSCQAVIVRTNQHITFFLHGPPTSPLASPINYDTRITRTRTLEKSMLSVLNAPGLTEDWRLKTIVQTSLSVAHLLVWWVTGNHIFCLLFNQSVFQGKHVSAASCPDMACGQSMAWKRVGAPGTGTPEASQYLL